MILLSSGTAVFQVIAVQFSPSVKTEGKDDLKNSLSYCGRCEIWPHLSKQKHSYGL